MRNIGSAAPDAMPPMRAVRLVMRPSAGAVTEVFVRFHSSLRQPQTAARRLELRLRALGGGFTLVVGGARQVARVLQRLGALEVGLRLGELRGHVDDLAFRLRDGRLPTRHRGVLLRDLRVE
jgi:hypothetical protein